MGVRGDFQWKVLIEYMNIRERELAAKRLNVLNVNARREKIIDMLLPRPTAKRSFHEGTGCPTCIQV